MKKVFLAALVVVLVVVIGRAFLVSPVPPGAPATEGAAKTPGGEGGDAKAQPATAAPGDAAAAPAAATDGASAPAKPLKPATKAVDVDVDELARGVQVVEFRYDPASLPRNPMTPLVGPQAVLANSGAAAGAGTTATPAQAEVLAQSMVVTGIIWDKRSPVAVVNDDVVAPGDTLPNGAVVNVIEQDKVVVKVGDTTIPLQLKHTEEH